MQAVIIVKVNHHEKQKKSYLATVQCWRQSYKQNFPNKIKLRWLGALWLAGKYEWPIRMLQNECLFVLFDWGFFQAYGPSA